MARIACKHCGQGIPDNLMATHVRMKHPEVVGNNNEAPPPIQTPVFSDDVQPFGSAFLEQQVAVLEPVVQPAEPAEPEPVIEEIQFPVPEIDPYFRVQDDMIQFFKLIEFLSLEGLIQKIKLTGPQGAGKTSMARQYSAIYQRPLYIVPCVTMQEQAQWFGLWQVNTTAGTFYVPAQFVKAIETPRCVVVLDDMNRVENPKVLNPLLPLLDDQRQVYSDDLRRIIRVADQVVFFGTVNEGYQFQGTDPIDTALNDRFFPVPVQYPQDNIIRQIIMDKAKCSYDDAELISRFATALATHPKDPIFMSMRRAIMIGQLIRVGATVRNAVKFGFMSDLEPEQLEHALASLQLLLQDDFTATTPKWESWTV